MNTEAQDIDMLSRAILTEVRDEAEQIKAEAKERAEAIRRRAQEQAEQERKAILDRANQVLVGGGLCGANAHAATLCPSFYRAEVVQNPKWHERLFHSFRSAVVRALQPA